MPTKKVVESRAQESTERTAFHFREAFEASATLPFPVGVDKNILRDRMGQPGLGSVQHVREPALQRPQAGHPGRGS